MPAPLVDSRGRPLRREVMTSEIAGPTVTGVRTILSGHPASGLTPTRLTGLLRAAEQGEPTGYFELAEEMEEKDLHYLSVLGTRKRAVAQLPIHVEAADDGEEAKADAALIERWLERDTLETELADILDAIGKGPSFTEIVWETGELWLPAQLKWRHPTWFEFDRIDGETPLLKNASGVGEPLAYGKFITHVHPAKTGLPVRGGLARAVAWGWMFKNYAVKDWVSFLEMYGQPIRVGRYDPGAAEGDIRKLMRAVAQIGTDAAAVFPRTMDLEFVDGKSGAAPNELWRSMAEYIDDQVSKAVLGQTSSADAKAGGIGSGQADLHGQVRDDIARADAKLLAATLNRDLVRPIIQFNRGMRAAYPRIRIGKPDPVDVKALVDAAERLVPLGVEVDAEAMREMAGLPAPKSPAAKRLAVASAGVPEKAPQEGVGASGGKVVPESAADALLPPLKTPQGQKNAPPRATASATPENSAPERIADGIDIAGAELLSDWDEMFGAVIDPVRDMIAASSSLAEAQAGLAGRLAAMDIESFAERMAQAGFGARIGGEIDAAGDEGRDDESNG